MNFMTVCVGSELLIIVIAWIVLERKFDFILVIFFV